MGGYDESVEGVLMVQFAAALLVSMLWNIDIRVPTACNGLFKPEK